MRRKEREKERLLKSSWLIGLLAATATTAAVAGGCVAIQATTAKAAWSVSSSA